MVKRARYVFVVALGAAFVAACELVAGIHAHDFLLPDADTDAAEAEASPPETCAHTSPPAAPSRASGTDLGRTLVFALRTLDLSGKTASSVAVGFDLDGVCTCDAHDGTPRDGGLSCKLPAAPLVPGACDKPGGVDNAFGAVYAQFIGYPQGEKFPALLNQSFDCGKQTLLLLVGGYNGEADDEHVTVAPIFSRGIREESDGSTPYPDAGCNSAFAPFPAKWDGNDRWSVPPGTITRLPSGDPAVLGPVLSGWVSNWELVVDQRSNPNAAPVPFFFADTSALTSQPVIAARLVPLDSSGAEIKDGGAPTKFRLVDGILAGRSSAASLLSAIGAFHVRGDGGTDDIYVCSPILKGIYDDLKATTCNARDVTISVDAAASSACDSISMALLFTADRATIGAADYDIPPPDGGACGPGFRDSCE